MTTASIRLADMRDAAAIAHVHVQSWLTTYKGLVPDSYLATLQEAERIPLWQKWLALDVDIFVADLDGAVVGFACGSAIREPLRHYDAELYSLYLLREVQGRGIGKSLLSTAANALLKRGYRSMAVWALETNPAVRFYEKMGAHYLTSKQIRLGGAKLTEIALGWPDLQSIGAIQSA
ncbi:GNAT family N-acetyltransferase [Silvibacterium sp.]|uniref:GNAT family N-acetyltransferase n=1 Tax=Silvibacterium sp. TaxID=1964179 RepID=UPI0039E36372